MPKTTAPERWVIAIYMLVRNPRGRVLMLRRSQAVKHFPGCWELPGGKPAPGEEIGKTAELELAEEAGLCVTPRAVAGAVEGSVPGLRVAMLVLEGRTTDSKVTLSSEHDTHCWVPLARVPALKLRPGFDKFFAQYSARPFPKKSGNSTAANEQRK